MIADGSVMEGDPKDGNFSVRAIEIFKVVAKFFTDHNCISVGMQSNARKFEFRGLHSC